MNKVQLSVIGLTSGQTQGSYTLILGEKNGRRKLAIIIGSFEAQSIAIEIEKIVPFRPMTHDLFVSLSHLFDIELKEAMIHKLQEGVFYAKLVCVKNGETHDIDARTSDAIALAVRFKCPVYTTDEIMLAAGHEINIEEKAEEENEDVPEEDFEPEKTHIPGLELDEFSSLTHEELNVLLEEAIKVEDYQRAALIRDEMNKRS